MRPGIAGRRGLAPVLALALAACATQPPQIAGGGWLAECRSHYLALDAQTAGDGIRDAGTWRVPGFPYLRSNRFLSSFVGGLDRTRFMPWVEHLRQLDLQSRRTELQNLGGGDVEGELRHLDRCGAAWAERDLADPARQRELLQRVAVPDDYSRTRRILGLYTLAVPFLNLGINSYQQEVQDDFAYPLGGMLMAIPLVHWQPPQAAAASAREIAHWLAQADALGIPQLDDDQWWRMAAAHAPSWWVETGGDHDRPGRLVLRAGAPAVDAGDPVVYFMPAFTRFGGRVLPQLVYTMWFPERPKAHALDPYGGRLDGLVWRVTLDTDGTPLAYDTIHPCGCFHQVFPAKPLPARALEDFWQESVLMPQAELPAGRPALRVRSGTHALRRVAAQDEVQAGEARTYALADYRELLSLPDGDGRRSLFCADGLVCGTQRLERFWLWVTGVDSPGAMRQWGRHATAFVGRRHFDEPFLLEKLFVAR